MGTYRLRVPASRVGYVPEAQGGLPPGTTYCTYWVHVPASGVGYVPRTVAPQVINAPGFLRATWSVVERLMPDWWGVRVGSLQDLGIDPDELV